MLENEKWKSVAGVASAFVSAFFYTMGPAVISLISDKCLIICFKLVNVITLTRWYPCQEGRSLEANRACILADADSNIDFDANLPVS